MPTVVITGSAGLIGSACARLLADLGWRVVGIDNDLRASLLGPDASTLPVAKELERLPDYEHHAVDIRARGKVRQIFRDTAPSFVIHTAAQPSHDRAAEIPYDDFEVNAVGTLNILMAAREFSPDAPFCFTSTNKVYGDRPNRLPLRELETRFDYADGRDGIDESMSVDQSMHTLLGASKLSADVLCQEFARTYGMPIGVFRASCVTGSAHAAVEAHGFLAYIVDCAVQRRPYTVFGYGGKQVRDQIHAADVASLFLKFFEHPMPGEVYNLGGGRANSLSILETIHRLEAMGLPLTYSLDPRNRRGDHICYISDTAKLRTHFPAWRIRYDLSAILDEIVEHRSRVGRRAVSVTGIA